MVTNSNDKDHDDELIKKTLSLIRSGGMTNDEAIQILESFYLAKNKVSISKRIARSPILWSAIFRLMIELLKEL